MTADPGGIEPVDLEQPRQLAGHLPLPDEWVSKQGTPYVDLGAGPRRGDREPLVGRHVLDESEQQRFERGTWQWVRTIPVDARRQLDDVVVGEPWDCAVVAHVHHLNIAGACRQRGEQGGGCLAVERTPALLEKFPLAGESWVR